MFTGTRTSRSPSVQLPSTVRKRKRVQTMLTKFLERKNISGPEETSSPEDEEPQVEENENSETIESPPKTRDSPRKVSKTQPESSNKSTVQKRVAENRKLRNKTREDVKKNLSAIIGDSETENLTEKNSNKNKLNETQDSDLNLSNMMAVAQSTQYPDDYSDISEKTEKKSLVGDFLTSKNQNQPKDSGIEDDSTEESAKLKGKCKKVIDNKKSTPKQKYARKAASNNINTIQNNSNNDKTLCLEAEDVTEVESLKEAETLGNDENGFTQNNEPHKEKHPPKIIGSEIVDKKYKILSKEQEGLTEIPEGEEEIDVVGMEQCDESESPSWKLKESKENDEREEKSEQRKIKRKEEHGKKSNFGKGEKKKEFEAEKEKEEYLTDRVQDEIEESDEGLEKIKKFIIKKPIDKKLINQERTPKKGKKSEEQSIRKLEMREESSEEKTDKEIKKSRKEKVKKSKMEKEGTQEQNKKDHESHSFSSSESEFEEQKEGKEIPKKQSEERKLSLEEKDDSINKEGSKNEEQQEKRKVEEKVKDFSSDDDSESDKEKIKQKERRKVSEKVKEVSSEEDSEGKNDEVKRKEIQEEKAKVEEKRKTEEKVNYSSSEEDSESENQEVRQKEIIQQEKVKESSSEEESEDEKEVKQKEIHKPKNVTERRKVKGRKEYSRSSEEEKENEDPKLKPGVENNDKKDENGEADEEKDEREDNEEQEREELISDDEEVNLKIVEKPLTENGNIESNDTEKIETENEDSSEVKMNSREIFTQFVDRKHDSESEEEKQDEEELRLTLEHEETYVNLDDNKITIEEHKIEVPENPATSDEGEEAMSAKSLKKVQQMKRLDLTIGSDSSSDEEFSQAQMNQDKKFVIKEKSDSSHSESEEAVKKISPKKKDSPNKKSYEKKGKSPKKKEIPKDLVQSSGESEDDSKEDEKEKTKEIVQPDEDRDFYNYIQEGVSFLQQQKDEEKQRSNSRAIENIETQNLESSQVISDPDTQISLENEKTKSKESRKKELEAECPKYALSNLESARTKFRKGIEHQVVVDKMQEFNKNDKATTENFQKMTEV